MTKRRIAFLSVLFLFLAGAVQATPAQTRRANPDGLGATAPTSAIHPAPSAMGFAVNPGLVTREVRELTDEQAYAIIGSGSSSDFWCGVASGAGLALSASGVLTPVGVALGVGGIYCAVFL